MLRSLIAQLASQHNTCPAGLQSLLFSRTGNHDQLSTVTLLKALHDTILEFDVVSVIIDALDESQERESLLHIIGEMMKWKSETLHLLVASRDKVDIAARFSEMLTEPLETFALSLQTDVVDGDIQSYVQAQLATSQALSKWKHYKDLQLSIIEKLREAKGMYVFPYTSAALVKCFILTKNRFRWALCQLDALAKCRTRAQIKLTLSERPETLYETYDKMLQQIPEADARYAHRLLQCSRFPPNILCSYRSSMWLLHSILSLRQPLAWKMSLRIFRMCYRYVAVSSP
jgi:hypothetical protein